ncbi:mitochondrial sodium/calcium exchanger protein isoform X2 [Dermatophagoides farinae]|uniref:Mitochondrial sodium/calcium exchanger protein n=2 Tax=Dermatophagoides farinae TaxID=6954 RepID=A0A922HPN2_DERFA|nr:mitochondrial sodium/calcium exchanger protein-like [Dermatophagoides farinae]KAH7637946.1 sodium/potassium/calcium exchanger 6 [Dermatophagoides farinae]KAH9501444.1 Mitochondrial sodium/calcium exchanger protein [Dermatophagoides farinae]
MMKNFSEQIIIQYSYKIGLARCRDVENIHDIEKRCHFIRTTAACAYDGILFSPIELAYCQFDELPLLSFPILLAMLFMLFFIVGLVADEFLCPSLLTISKTLRLPNNIAGVTLLAFGNGAPDIFSSIEGISHSKPNLIFASLFGGGTFVTTIVIGSIILNGEFIMSKRPLVRDIVFYIGATFMTWAFIYGRTLKIDNVIALVCYYHVYIITIFISRYVYLRFQKPKQQQPVMVEEPRLSEISVSIIDVDDDDQILSKSASKSSIMNLSRKSSQLSYGTSISDLNEIDDDMIRSRFYRNSSIARSTRSRKISESKHIAHHHWSNTIHSVSKSLATDEDYLDNNDSIDSHSYLNQNEYRITYLSQFSMVEMMSETKNFLLHICPIDLLEWNENSFIKKLFELIKAGPYFLLIVCIPVVDLESVNENWCRLLCCINIVIAPQIILFLQQIDYEIDHQFPIWALLLIISPILIIFILLTSDKNRPPIYHRIFAFIGFIISIIFIKVIANEIISILHTIGILFHLSDSFLGLTILALGNSVGDLMSNLSMARHGYHSMAIAACIGGPLFNLLIGLGVPYLTLFIKNGNFHGKINIHYTHMISLPYAALTTSLCTSLLIFVLGKFRSYRIHGYILIIIYIVYIILAILLEFKVI